MFEKLTAVLTFGVTADLFVSIEAWSLYSKTVSCTEVFKPASPSDAFNLFDQSKYSLRG